MGAPASEKVKENDQVNSTLELAFFSQLLS